VTLLLKLVVYILLNGKRTTHADFVAAQPNDMTHSSKIFETAGKQTAAHGRSGFQEILPFFISSALNFSQ
jgi:hypothetical protein